MQPSRYGPAPSAYPGPSRTIPATSQCQCPKFTDPMFLPPPPPGGGKRVRGQTAPLRQPLQQLQRREAQHNGLRHAQVPRRHPHAALRSLGEEVRDPIPLPSSSFSFPHEEQQQRQQHAHKHTHTQYIYNHIYLTTTTSPGAGGMCLQRGVALHGPVQPVEPVQERAARVRHRDGRVRGLLPVRALLPAGRPARQQQRAARSWGPLSRVELG